MFIRFLFLCSIASTGFSQETLSEKQLSAMYEQGVIEAREVNNLATLSLRQELNDYRSFSEEEPKLKEVKKGKNQAAYLSEVRKAKAFHREQMDAYQKRKEQFEATTGRKIAELRKELEKRDSEGVPWVFPKINLLNVKEDQIGVFGNQYIDSDSNLKTKYWMIEFLRKRGETDSVFWTDKNTVLVIAGLPSNRFAKAERYPISKPVVNIAPTDPERYLQYRVLADGELKQIQTYVEKRSGKRINFDEYKLEK